MKRLIGILPFIIFCSGFSQTKTTDSGLPTPPNCVPLTENLFIDKTEITNISWMEYLYYLQRDSSRQVYNAALPDTTVWFVVGDSSKAYNYLRYPGSRFKPVVGITYDQALGYCKWRSAAVNQVRSSNHVYEFRLPTEEEWELAASGGLNADVYPYGYKSFMQSVSLQKDWTIYYATIKSSIGEEDFKNRFNQFRKKEKEPFFNCLKPFDALFYYGTMEPLASLDHERRADKHYALDNKPNSLGIFDMIGNISEMTATEGLAKGGSWGSKLEECKINARQYYSLPSPYLGFRCVCEVTVKE